MQLGLLIGLLMVAGFVSSTDVGPPVASSKLIDIAASQFNPTINETIVVTCAWTTKTSSNPIMRLQVASDIIPPQLPTPVGLTAYNWTHITQVSQTNTSATWHVRFDSGPQQTLPSVCDSQYGPCVSGSLRLQCVSPSKPFGLHGWSSQLSLPMHRQDKPASPCARLDVQQQGLWNVDTKSILNQCAALNCTGALNGPDPPYQGTPLVFSNSTLWCQEPTHSLVDILLCDPDSFLDPYFKHYTCGGKLYDGTSAGCSLHNTVGNTNAANASLVQTTFDACVAAKDVSGNTQCQAVIYGYQKFTSYVNPSDVFNGPGFQCTDGWCVACAHQSSLRPNWAHASCTDFLAETRREYHELDGHAQIYALGCDDKHVVQHNLSDAACQVSGVWSSWAPSVPCLSDSQAPSALETQLVRHRTLLTPATGAGQCDSLLQTKPNPDNTPFCVSANHDVLSRDTCGCQGHGEAMTWCPGQEACFPSDWRASPARPFACREPQHATCAASDPPVYPNGNLARTLAIGIGSALCLLSLACFARRRRRRANNHGFVAFSAPPLMPTHQLQQPYPQQQYYAAAPPPPHKPMYV